MLSDVEDGGKKVAHALYVSQVKVIHHICHEDIVKECDVGIVFTLKEGMIAVCPVDILLCKGIAFPSIIDHILSPYDTPDTYQIFSIHFLVIGIILCTNSTHPYKHKWEYVYSTLLKQLYNKEINDTPGFQPRQLLTNETPSFLETSKAILLVFADGFPLLFHGEIEVLSLPFLLLSLNEGPIPLIVAQKIAPKFTP